MRGEPLPYDYPPPSQFFSTNQKILFAVESQVSFFSSFLHLKKKILQFSLFLFFSMSLISSLLSQNMEIKLSMNCFLHLFSIAAQQWQHVGGLIRFLLFLSFPLSLSLSVPPIPPLPLLFPLLPHECLPRFQYASGLLCLSQDGGIVEGLSRPLKIRTPHLKSLNDYLVTKRGLIIFLHPLIFLFFIFVLVFSL